METIRDIKTLLRLLLAKGEELSVSKKDTKVASMCGWAMLLYYSELTLEEYHILDNFIYENRPTKGIYFDKEFANSDYFWSPRDFDIRLRWIKYQLRRKL